MSPGLIAWEDAIVINVGGTTTNLGVIQTQNGFLRGSSVAMAVGGDAFGAAGGNGAAPQPDHLYAGAGTAPLLAPHQQCPLPFGTRPRPPWDGAGRGSSSPQAAFQMLFGGRSARETPLSGPYEHKET